MCAPSACAAPLPRLYAASLCFACTTRVTAGAALELSTILAPHAFLPLACSANLAKNLAAVAASSTRAPIYRTFALQNNLADITAKGESVANLADILGTLAGECADVSFIWLVKLLKLVMSWHGMCSVALHHEVAVRPWPSYLRTAAISM
jgi:hypothetical protein